MNTDGNINAIERHLADCEEHDAWQDLQDQLEAARADAKEAEAYAEELEKAMKKDWNDGTIHGWNGGDCPVHPETVVEYWLWNGGCSDTTRAGCLWWGHSDSDVDCDIIAFRVVKEYVEPALPAASRVLWVNEEADGIHVAYDSEEKARNCAAYSLVTRIAVKYQEVRE